MGQREHADKIVARAEEGEFCQRELNVGRDGTVGNHYALGEARRAGCVVDDGQVFHIGSLVDHILAGEAFRVTVAEQGVEIGPRIVDFLTAGKEQVEFGDVEESVDCRHFFR